jgi:predicted nucleic acid-binding protein
VLDTSVVIAEAEVDLPDEAAISTATLAELHFGVLLARDDEARRSRLRRLSEVESRFEALAVDGAVARSYGALAHAVAVAGRKPRARTMDLLIAATAQANGAALYTRDRGDLAPLDGLLEVIVV